MKRSPHRLQSYLDTHHAHMDSLRREGTVGGDTIEWGPAGGSDFRLHGEIACIGDIVISVDKTLEIQSGNGHQALVLGALYKYNAHLAGNGVIVRYDNVHKHNGHRDEYHKHDGDPFAGTEHPAVWVGRDNWPTLADVIREVRGWRDANYSRLERPDAFPILNARGK